MSGRLAAKLAMATSGAIAALVLASGPSSAQEAATPATAAPASSAPAATADAASIAHGKELFANYGCGGCHTLADAGAAGDVGPSLDGDTNLTPALIEDRVTNGSGPMPSFGSSMSPADIAAVAAYVMHAKK